MFCSAVSDGNEVEGLEHEADAVSRRTLLSASSSRLARSRRHRGGRVPAVGRSRPAAQCRNVLLPDPDGPITAVNDPRANPKETSRRAATLLPPLPYILLTDDSRTLSVAAACVSGLDDARLHGYNVAAGWAQRKTGGLAVRGAGFPGVSRVRLGAQEHQHGEHAPRLAPGRRQAELAEDARDVLLDRAQRDHELVGDALVGAAAWPSARAPRARAGSAARAGRPRRCRESSVETMIGSSAEPPSATRRTAARNSSTSLIRSLSR